LQENIQDLGEGSLPEEGLKRLDCLQRASMTFEGLTFYGVWNKKLLLAMVAGEDKLSEDVLLVGPSKRKTPSSTANNSHHQQQNMNNLFRTSLS
jgi:hypothetical protein